MTVFLQLTVTGLSNGMIYALVAVGFVILYKASDVINFSQGEFLLLGAFFGYTFLGELGLPIGVGLLLTVGAAAVVGLIVQWAVIRPLIGEPVIAMIMATIALSSILRAVTQAIWGVRPRSFPSFLPSADLQIGGAIVSSERLWTVGIGLTLLGALAMFFRVGREGIAMRAVADDPQAAMSMGIRLPRTLAIAWAMAAATAALGGVLLASLVGVGQNITFIGLRVFPVVILGGLDSMLGAVVGGAIIGLVEAYAGGYIGMGFQSVLPFVVLVVILLVRPYGLFGREKIERV